MDELIDLDFESIDGLTPEAEGQRSQWAPVFSNHPDTWRLLVEFNERIVGYWHVVCLQNEIYQSVRGGLIADSQLCVDTLQSIDSPGSYNLYIVSACLRREHQGTEAVQLLISSLLDVIEDLAKQGVFVNEMLANAYSSKGAALLRRLGFHVLKKHSQQGQMVALDFTKWATSNPLARKKLLQLYRKYTASSVK